MSLCPSWGAMRDGLGMCLLAAMEVRLRILPDQDMDAAGLKMDLKPRVGGGEME